MTTYLHHIYQGGTRIATWGGDAGSAQSVLSSSSFSMEVDGSIGPLAIELARPFGDSSPDLAIGNVVRTYAMSAVGALTQIHEGTIETVTDRATASGDRVTVTVQPYVTQLALDHFRDDAAGTVIAKSWSSTEVATILEYILDRAIQRSGKFARIRYDGDSVATTGKTLSIEVGSETYLSAIRRVKKLGPGNYYWYVEPSGRFVYRAYASGTRHRLTLGRDIMALDRTRDLSETRNTVYFWNQSDADGTVIAFERPETTSLSQSTYGRRVEVVTDSRIDSESTAESVTEAYLREHEDPVTTLQATVVAPGVMGSLGFEIERLHPGDTVEIANVPALAKTAFSILRVDYRPESASLTLGVGPARRPRMLGMSIEEMAEFMRTSTDGSIPPETTA